MIVICTPSRDTAHIRFTFDLVNLAIFEARTRKEDIVFLPNEGSLLPSQRENLVQEAMNLYSPSHILFLDTDMRFPPTLLMDLLKWNASIVACNCKDRKTDMPTAVFTDDGECVSVGAAVMLVQLKVFRSIPEPWFALPWDPVGKRLVGEDRYFCRKVKEAGFTITIDHDLSKRVRHIGAKEYGFDE